MARTLVVSVFLPVRDAEATLREALDSLRTQNLWGAGPVGKAFARELLAQRGRLLAFVDVEPRKLGRRICGAPVVSVDESAAFRDSLALGAVAGGQARAEIRQAVASQGGREGVDFVAVA